MNGASPNQLQCKAARIIGVCTVSVLLDCDINAKLRFPARTRDTPFTPPPIAIHSRFQVGVSRDPQTFLQPGDTVTCSIETVGSITNPVQGQHVHTVECGSDCEG